MESDDQEQPKDEIGGRVFKLGCAIFVVVVVGILVTAWLVGDQGNLPFDYEGFD